MTPDPTPSVLPAADALLIVDMQNDFVSGSLPVPGAVETLPIIANMAHTFELLGKPLFFTRCRHPKGHVSFIPRGDWPVHCVDGTWGAEVVDALLPLWARSPGVDKGTDVDVDAYNGFMGTTLYAMLLAHEVKSLLICGLATDVCVKETAIGARTRGFDTKVVLNACRPVTAPGGLRAMHEMAQMKPRPIEMVFWPLPTAIAS